ncbi:hypothetical protein L3Q82_024738, partial [Scortum barcoo]
MAWGLDDPILGPKLWPYRDMECHLTGGEGALSLCGRLRGFLGVARGWRESSLGTTGFHRNSRFTEAQSLGRSFGVEPLLLRIERESAEVARASVLDAPLDASLGRFFPGMSHREQASGKIQDMLERLCLSAGLEMPWSPLEELEEVSGVREVWASLLRLLPSATQSRIS